MRSNAKLFSIFGMITLLITPFLMAEKNSIEPGIYAAVLTPMQGDLSCPTQVLANHCQDLIQRGCKGIALFGTTGEGPSFSIQERLDILDKIIEQGVDPKKIILANGSSNIPESVALGKKALQKHCTAFLVAPPPFFKNVPEEGVIAFYREIIQKIDDPHLRVILYHIPQFTGVPITVKIIEALRSEFPGTIIGIKESEGNLALTQTILNRFPDFQVFVGNETHIPEAAYYGASGSICGMANLYPELICSLYQQGKQANFTLPKEIKNLAAALANYPFIPAFKALMEIKKGPAWHVLRPPLMPLSSAQTHDLIHRTNNSFIIAH
jgi:4-hydroxy-tetrahydrodipicolinate synthase